jgi:hypothetical protein
MINPHQPPAGIPPLDESLRLIAEQISASGRFPIGFDIPGPAARERSRAINREFYPELLFDVASVTDSTIPGPGGELRIRVQRPLTRTDATVVFFHGGSWIVGDLDSHRGDASRIAATSNAVVVQVDYRLAPEHPFPAGIEDACAAVEWIARNIGDFGGDPARLAVAGDSSGGNLAAVAAQHSRSPRSCWPTRSRSSANSRGSWSAGSTSAMPSIPSAATSASRPPTRRTSSDWRPPSSVSARTTSSTTTTSPTPDCCATRACRSPCASTRR